MSFLYICSFLILFIITLLYLFTFLIANHNNSFLDLLSPYECGLEPIGNNRIKFEMIYYIVALLYLIFDLEILFLFPFATIFYTSLISNFFAFSIAMFFIIILTLGFIFEWSQNALSFRIFIFPLILFLSSILFLSPFSHSFSDQLVL